MIGTLLSIAARVVAEAGRRDNVETKAKKDFELLGKSGDDIVTRLSQGENFDDIADAYATLSGVARPRTILAVADFVYALGTSEDAKAREIAALVAANQRVDSVVGPKEFVRGLTSESTIFMAGRCHGAEEGKTYAEGIYVLTTGYLFFFPYAEHFNYAAARAKGLASGALEAAVPGFGVLSGIFEVGSSVVEGAADFFSAGRLKELSEMLDRPAAFAVRLTDVKGCSTHPEKAQTAFKVTVRQNGAAQSYFLQQTGSNHKEWADTLFGVLPLACLAEGVLLNSVKKPS